MNLQPFYELRDRLAIAAAAGTQLLGEDFRLRAAAEKLTPYAKASPVFAKLLGLAKELLDGPEENRGRTLLNLAGLLDAFLITQGSWQAEGEMEEPRIHEQGNEDFPYREIPYSRLHSLRQALTLTGGGRQAVLEELHQEDPEMFSDYRVRPLLVQALGDGYGEIADMAYRWVIEAGSCMLPLLKENFRPDGKKDMVRRVRAISAIAGEKENDFYLQNLEAGRGEVREVLIASLCHCQKNIGILLDLTKTERNKAKRAACWALSFMEGEEAESFWASYPFQNGGEAASFFADSPASYAPRILAGEIRKAASEFLTEKKKKKDSAAGEKANKGEREGKKQQEEMKYALVSLIDACHGKLTNEIRDVLKWAAGENGMKQFRKHFASMMTDTVISSFYPGDPEGEAYIELAGKLWREADPVYAQPVFAAALISGSPKEVYGEYGSRMNQLGKEIFSVLQRLYFQEGSGYTARIKSKTDYNQEARDIDERFRFRRITDELDPGWYPLLVKYKSLCPKDHAEVFTPYNGFDALMYRLLRTDMKEHREFFKTYFYHRAMKEGPSDTDVRVLKQCGYTEFSGFIAAACKKFQDASWAYQVRMLIADLPLSREQVLSELREVKKSWEGKKIIGIGALDHWLKKLEDGANPDEL